MAEEKDDPLANLISGALLIGVVVAVCYWLFWPSHDTDMGEESPNAVSRSLSEGEVARKMSGVDLRPYDRTNYPKLFAQLGEETILGELQSVRAAGAREAAKLSRCDKVEMSDYSSNESKPGNLAVFVDCQNGFRIWYNRSGIIRTAQN